MALRGRGAARFLTLCPVCPASSGVCERALKVLKSNCRRWCASFHSDFCTCLLPLTLLHVPPCTQTFALRHLPALKCLCACLPIRHLPALKCLCACLPIVFLCVSQLCFQVPPPTETHASPCVFLRVSTLLVRVSSHSDTCRSYFCFPLYSLFLSTVFAERTTCHSDTSLGFAV